MLARTPQSCEDPGARGSSQCARCAVFSFCNKKSAPPPGPPVHPFSSISTPHPPSTCPITHPHPSSSMHMQRLPSSAPSPAILHPCSFIVTQHQHSHPRSPGRVEFLVLLLCLFLFLAPVLRPAPSPPFSYISCFPPSGAVSCTLGPAGAVSSHPSRPPAGTAGAYSDHMKLTPVASSIGMQFLAKLAWGI